MNENPFGTPNPLNNGENQPSPAFPPVQPAQPTTTSTPLAQPTATSTQPVQPIQPPITPIQPAQPFQSSEPIQPAQPSQSQPLSQPQPLENFDGETQPIMPATPPTGPTMQTANLATESPIKPKKTGAIIGIVLAVLVFVGAIGVGVFLLLNSNNSEDRFSKAIEKLFGNTFSEYVEVEGNVDLISAGSKSSFNIDSKINTTNFTNDTTLAISTDFLSGMLGIEEIGNTFNLEEIYTEDGEMYVKIDGLNEGSGDEIIAMTLGMMGTYLPSTTSESLNDEWIKISNLETNTDSLACFREAMGGVSLYDLYSKNTFLTATDKDVKIEKKSDSLYKVNVDSNKFSDFINSMITEDFINCYIGNMEVNETYLELDELENYELGDLEAEEELLNEEELDEILNLDDDELVDLLDDEILNEDILNITENDLMDLFDFSSFTSLMPSSFYVEIDKNYNITRFYLETASYESDFSLKIDLSIKTIEKFNVLAPSSFIESEDIFNMNIVDLDEDILDEDVLLDEDIINEDEELLKAIEELLESDEELLD